ncbi:MAG: hypothetical protein HQL59_11795, partial [Magnetococcales bacterium]|nr:hypothetical protein [Magnetococcales bacterium]
MTTSPNREQLLFLVTGGIILVLILLVVIFNMVRDPDRDDEEEPKEPRPMVKLTAPEGEKQGWVSSVSPAPIFDQAPRQPLLPDSTEPATATPPGPSGGSAAAPAGPGKEPPTKAAEGDKGAPPASGPPAVAPRIGRETISETLTIPPPIPPSEPLPARGSKGESASKAVPAPVSEKAAAPVAAAVKPQPPQGATAQTPAKPAPAAAKPGAQADKPAAKPATPATPP